MGLEQRRAFFPDKGRGENTERVFPHQFKEGGPQVPLCGHERTLPFFPVGFEQALPSVEGPDRYPIKFGDLLY